MNTRTHRLTLFKATGYKTPNKSLFIACLEAVAQILQTNTTYELCIRLCNQKESKQYNTQLRNSTKPTNVIAIDYQIQLPNMEHFLGDLLLCAPLVIQEAKAYAIRPRTHWAHLTVHGILHLHGFTHDAKKTAAVMKAHEKQALTRLGINCDHIQ